jgi:prophage regulatory protein
MDSPASAAQIPRDLDSPALLLRIRAVVKVTGLGRSTIYRLMADDQFPPPVRLAKRVVAWRRSDLERWTSAQRAAH